MNRVLHYIQDVEPIELNYLNQVTSNMDEKEFDQFIMMYATRRQTPMNILLFSLIGLLGIAGVHRFILGHIGLGILYLLTGGLCFIGTIVDAINHKKLSTEANIKVANDVLMMMETYR